MSPIPTTTGEPALPGYRGSYVRQRPADLALSIYAGAVPAAREWVLAEERIRLGDWRLRVQIVGASHVVVIRNGQSAFTETLVSRPVHARPRDPVDGLPAGCQGHLLTGIDGGSYNVALLRHQATSQQILEWERTMVADVPYRLACAYPGPPGGPWGVTAVVWELRGDALRLETYHTYPDDHAMVTTIGECRLDS